MERERKDRLRAGGMTWMMVICAGLWASPLLGDSGDRAESGDPIGRQSNRGPTPAFATDLADPTGTALSEEDILLTDLTDSEEAVPETQLPESTAPFLAPGAVVAMDLMKGRSPSQAGVPGEGSAWYERALSDRTRYPLIEAAGHTSTTDASTLGPSSTYRPEDEDPYLYDPITHRRLSESEARDVRESLDGVDEELAQNARY